MSSNSISTTNSDLKFSRIYLGSKCYYYNYSPTQFKVKFTLPSNLWIDLPKTYAENYFKRSSGDPIKYKGPIVNTRIFCKGVDLYDRPTFHLPEEEEKELLEYDPGYNDVFHTVQDGSMLFYHDYGGIMKFTRDTELEFIVEKPLQPPDLLLHHSSCELVLYVSPSS